MTSMKKQLKGTVIRKSGDKTIAVEVTSSSRHPLYNKKVVKSRRYLVHDQENKAAVGDEVIITESRPLSRKKRWTLLKPKAQNLNVKSISND